MAKLDRLPEQSIIDGFKGVVDYYYWKGIPVSRKWPVYRPYAASIQQIAARTAFAYINKLYATLPAIIIIALQAHATGTTQVAKDYLVRAYLKELFAMAPPDYFATEETQLEIRDRIGAVDASDPGSIIARLADALTELAQKLEPADLNIEAVTKDLQVDDKTDYQNHGNLKQYSRWGAIASSADWNTHLSYTGKGLLCFLDISTSYLWHEIRLEVDGLEIYLPRYDGTDMARVSPFHLHATGADSAWWKEDLHDAVNNYYHFHLKQTLQFNSSLVLRSYQFSGVSKNLALQIVYRDLT